MTLDQLKEELLERFITACDELDYLAQKEKLAEKTVYSTASRYDLEQYKNGNIPPGGKMSDTPPEQNPYAYGLDSHNRPCHSRSEHTWNKLCWEGFYNYSETLVEYVEFGIESGKPNMIIRLHLENTSQYVFVEQPEEMTFQELSDQVALQIAQAIADAVASVQFNAPLAIMQLGYREVSSYDPYVTVLTQQDQKEILDHTPKENLLEELFIAMGQDIRLAVDKFDRLLTAFLNKVEEADDYQLATAMIRKAASLLTHQQLFSKGKVSDDFIAFAVDWSMIPDDLAQMMRECGMTSHTLEKWQKFGLFLP